MPLRPSPESTSYTCPYYRRNVAGLTSTVTQTNDLRVMQNRTWSGVRTPNYSSKKKTKTLPINGYDSNVCAKRSVGSVSYYAVNGVNSQEVRTFPIYYTYSEPLSSVAYVNLATDAQNKAVRKLYEAVDVAKFNAAQFFAERKQTAEILASAATRVANALRALKHGDVRTFTQSLSLNGSNLGDRQLLTKAWKKAMRTPPHRRISNHWLEFVFGWKPLLHDIDDAASLLADTITRSPARYRGVLKVSGFVSQRVEKANPSPTDQLIQILYSDVYAARVRIKAFYSLDSLAVASLSRTGITNPALVAWELVPWSFVVDWFLPVGDYLESLTAMDGFSLTAGSISTLETAASTRLIRPKAVAGWSMVRFDGNPRVLSTQGRYKRISTTSFPYALKLRSPIPKEPLERFTTALALIGQLVGRK